MSWIEAHAFTLLIILSIVIAAVPIIGNAAIRILRRGGRKSPAADWLARMIPFVLDALHFAQDVIVNPRQFQKIEKRAAELEDDPSPASAARMVVAVREVEIAKSAEMGKPQDLPKDAK